MASSFLAYFVYSIPVHVYQNPDSSIQNIFVMIAWHSHGHEGVLAMISLDGLGKKIVKLF
jgi:hypothetical protein